MRPGGHNEHRDRSFQKRAAGAVLLAGTMLAEERALHDGEGLKQSCAVRKLSEKE